MPERITKPKILLVEGKDEINLFEQMLSDLELGDDIQIIEVGGKEKFSEKLPSLQKASEFRHVTSIGIIRDADNNPQGAFQSICSILQRVNLPQPTNPLDPVIGPPQVTVMIVPDGDTPGMIESVCLNSVNDDPAMACVDQYFQCLQERHRKLAENDIPKARVRSFLASREWLEIAHFECIQRCEENYELTIPRSPAVAIPKVHAFLASRYTPNLDLGIAARKSEREDRYWQFNHPAFDKIKQFLRIL
jgi:hypothetical protein